MSDLSKQARAWCEVLEAAPIKLFTHQGQGAKVKAKQSNKGSYLKPWWDWNTRDSLA